MGLVSCPRYVLIFLDIFLHHDHTQVVVVIIELVPQIVENQPLISDLNELCSLSKEYDNNDTIYQDKIKVCWALPYIYI